MPRKKLQRAQKVRSKASTAAKGISGRVRKTGSRSRNGIMSHKIVHQAAPVAFGNVEVGMATWPTFGRAAPHKSYPEGGLRMSGEIANITQDGTAIDDSGKGIFLDAAGTISGLSQIAVSPTALATSATSNLIDYPLFGTSSAVAVTAQYFRHFRFRKLELIYETGASTGAAGTILMNYSDNPLDATITISSQNKFAGSRSHRFPIWTPQYCFPCIQEKGSNAADELYVCTAANDSVVIATATSAEAYKYFQGVITCLNSGTGTATVLGNYMIRFVLDLYGFQNQPPTAVTDEKQRERDRAINKERAERKHKLPSNCRLGAVSQPNSRDFQRAALVDPDTGGYIDTVQAGGGYRGLAMSHVATEYYNVEEESFRVGQPCGNRLDATGGYIPCEGPCGQLDPFKPGGVTIYDDTGSTPAAVYAAASNGGGLACSVGSISGGVYLPTQVGTAASAIPVDVTPSESKEFIVVDSVATKKCESTAPSSTTVVGTSVVAATPKGERAPAGVSLRSRKPA